MRVWFSVFLAIVLAACGGGQPPQPQPPTNGPGSSNLAAPANIAAEPGDGSAVVSWDGVLDPKVVGYNIYVDDKKVNGELVVASSGKAVSLAGVPRFSFTVQGLENGKNYKFNVTTVEDGGKESKVSPPASTAPVIGAAEIMVNPLTPATASPNQLPAGDRREIFFEVQKPGKIEITASFSGTDLALILNGPGELNYYQRVDGAGPLTLTQDVSETELAKGTQWRASLINFSNKAADGVQMNINRPLVTGPGDNIAASTIVNPLTPVGATPNSLPADGTRELFFEVQRTGRISVKAEFSGTNLALILNGPRQLGYYARVDGAGPLTLTYDVTAADLKKGTQWRLRLKNFSNSAAQNVQITLGYPHIAELTPGDTIGQILTNAIPKSSDPPNALSAGDRREIQFEVHRPGKIEVKASFNGTPLALILNGPGQLGFYERVDGNGPLTLTHNVTASEVQKGTSWRVSLVNFSATKANDVLMDIRYPTLIYKASDKKYLVQGTDMGAQFQNIKISSGGTGFTAANVKVNTIAIAHNSGGLYQGNLGSAVAVGGAINLEVGTPDGNITATDKVPESPAVTAPAAGAVISASNPLNVTWTSATNPDRFRVSATWSCGPSCGTGTSFDAAGTARNLTIPAGSLPANTAVKIRVYAYNDGTETFSGPFETGSRMAIRNGNEGGKDITTLPVGSQPGTSWGDPHLISFDGLAIEFQSTGEFDLAMSNSADFRVQARQRPWGGSSVVSVNTAIATKMNGQKLGLYVGLTPPLRLGDAGTPTTVPAGGLDLGAGNKVMQDGVTYTFIYPGGERMVAGVNSGYIDVRIYLPPTRSGAMKGLLGNFDGNPGNELMKRDGTVLPQPVPFAQFYGEYADDWRVPSLAESLFFYASGESFGGFKVANFPSPTPIPSEAQRAAAKATCIAAGVTDPILLENCIIDIINTGQNSFATSAANAQIPSQALGFIGPDLTVNLSGVASATPGENIGSALTILAKNIGNAPATGSAPGTEGYMVDIILSTDTNVPPGFATPSPIFSEDVLLTGGRVSNTPTLAGGVSLAVSEGAMTLPTTIPSGNYFLCARIDPGNKVAESDESNNTFCMPLRVAARPDLIVTAASLRLAEVCKPFQTFLVGSVTVKNIGTAASPARSDVGLAQLVDARDETLGAGYRGNGVGLPAIAAGASATVNLNIFYPIATPEDTEGTLNYVARVNFGEWIEESNYANNRFGTTVSITIPAGHCKNRVALIYGTNSSAVDPYKSGLRAKGLRISAIPVGKITANTTFSNYDLIAIDTFSGNLTNWDGSADAVSAIKNSGKPILGIGEGGYAFLGKLSSPIGSPFGWHGSDAKGFTVLAPPHVSLSGPFSVNTSGSRVEVSSANMNFAAIHLPTPGSLELVGRQEGDATHYIAVVDAKNKTALWGFDGLPTKYTTDGWNALANLAWYMLP